MPGRRQDFQAQTNTALFVNVPAIAPSADLQKGIHSLIIDNTVLQWGATILVSSVSFLLARTAEV